MTAELIKDLENAAGLLNAAPHLVTSAERRAAEAVFVNFRQSKSPYGICREILETSKVEFVLFEAAEVIKRALIREWAFLLESDVVTLRQYLMHFIISRDDLPPYVQDRLLQVVSIMVKRGSVDDFGRERAVLLTEIESLIVGADHQKRLLGCKLILNLMQEYALTVKSTDVGLPWEVHFKVKKQFEVTDVKRIFKFSLGVLREIIVFDAIRETQLLHLTKYLLMIAEKILCWGFRTSMLPKKLIGVYETLCELDEAPCLRLGVEWKEIMLSPELLSIAFRLYWRAREREDLLRHAMSCLVQLASLNGPVFKSREDKMGYLLCFMENFLKLTGSATIKSEEALGISNLIKKLEVFFGKDIVGLPSAIRESYLDDLTRLTCMFAQQMSSKQSNNPLEPDCYFSEAFDNILGAWAEIVKDFSEDHWDMLAVCARRIFDVYLQCHLAPTDGFRSHDDSEVEEIEDNEDNDRVKYQEQLQTVGMLGRIVLQHSLPVLYRLLESRIVNLGLHLQNMQSRPMTIDESTRLDDVFEDIHWIVLISGHVLCMESEGETPLIPSDINKFSIKEQENGVTFLEDTLKSMAVVHRNFQQEIFSERCDKTMRILCNVLRLCHLETSAAQVKLAHFMSPEVGCTLMWFLKRFSMHYILPVEEFYDQISPMIVGTLGTDTEGSVFVLNIILIKIAANIMYFNSEPILLQDTVNLFGEIVSVRLKSSVLIKNEGLWNLWTEQSRLDPGTLPPNVRRNLYKAFVTAGGAVPNKKHISDYYERILSPVYHRFKSLIMREDLGSVYQEERVRVELTDILECFIGIARGSQMSTVDILFQFLSPALYELPNVINLYKNYQIVVQSVLELFGQCAKCMLVFLGQSDARKLYENILRGIETYSKVNVNKFSLENIDLQEEGLLEDLDLILKLLTYVLSKDCLDLSDRDEVVNITAVDVVLYGLNFATPLITIDLLKHPALCSQYYKIIVLTNDIYPDKICLSPGEFLDKLLTSIEIGLTQFSSDVVQSCLDFLESLVTYLYRNKPQIPIAVQEKVSRFLRILFDLSLTRQFNTDVISNAGTCIYCLVCCYENDYKILIGDLVKTIPDTLIAERLAVAFTKLTENVPLNGERTSKLKFRDNFDKFIANVQGFLLVK